VGAGVDFLFGWLLRPVNLVILGERRFGVKDQGTLDPANGGVE